MDKLTAIITRAKYFRFTTKDGVQFESRVSPSPNPQVLDGWVKDTLLYQYGIQDGSITEIEIKSPAPSAAPSQGPASAPGGLLDPAKPVPGQPVVPIENKTVTTAPAKDADTKDKK